MSERISLPKLSSLLDNLAKPELDLADIVETATGVRPPPGPMTMLKTFAESIEAAGLPPLPELPMLQLPTVTKKTETTITQAPTKREVPVRKTEAGVYKP